MVMIALLAWQANDEIEQIDLLIVPYAYQLEKMIDWVWKIWASVKGE